MENQPIMLSYHNKPELKTVAVRAAQAHRDQDKLLTGTYGQMNGQFRGCSVGCDYYDITHRSPDEEYGNTNYHATTGEYFGFPEWLERLRDALFEHLPEPDRFDFHVQLKETVPVGINLEPVKHHLTIARMDRLIALQTDSDYEIVAALGGVRRCAEAELGGNHCDWLAARSAARSVKLVAPSAVQSAARSAEWATLSAMESATPMAAVLSVARSAESAARSAAWHAADRAADSVEWSVELAAYRAERDSLLQILRGL